MRLKKDPLLWFADPIFNGNGRKAPASDKKSESPDALDREIEQLIDSSRFRLSVAIAKAELLDELRAALRSGRAI